MFSNPTAVTFIGYLIVMVGVGVFAYYYTRSYTDLFSADAVSEAL